MKKSQIRSWVSFVVCASVVSMLIYHVSSLQAKIETLEYTTNLQSRCSEAHLKKIANKIATSNTH